MNVIIFGIFNNKSQDTIGSKIKKEFKDKFRLITIKLNANADTKYSWKSFLNILIFKSLISIVILSNVEQTNRYKLKM